MRSHSRERGDLDGSSPPQLLRATADAEASAETSVAQEGGEPDADGNDGLRVGGVGGAGVEALAALATSVNDYLELEPMVTAALPLVCELTDSPVGWIHLKGAGVAEEDGARAPRLAATHPIDTGSDLGAHGLKPCHGEQILLREGGRAVDLRRCEQIKRSEVTRLGTRHHWSVPLVAPDRRVMGVLSVLRARDDTTDPSVLEPLAAVLSSGVDRAQRREAELGAIEQRRRAVEVGGERDSTEGERSRLEQVLIQSGSDLIIVFDAKGLVTYVSEAVQRTLGYQPRQLLGRQSHLVKEDDLARVVATIDTIVDTPGATAVAEFEAQHVDGSWRSLRARFTNLLTDDTVKGIVANCHDVTEMVHFRAELARQSLHDQLTGLPNRTLLVDRVTQALGRSRNRGLAILLVDIDHFTTVNDSLGHEVGDRLLAEVAQRLRQAAPAIDTVARLGADEFVVVSEAPESEDAAILAAHQLAASARGTYRFDHHDLFVTVSAGFVFAAGGEQSPGDLLTAASVAMHRAKEEGRDRVEVFEEEMRARSVEKMATYQDLQAAIQRDQLRLLFQPQVSLATQAPVGVEALVAWDRPGHGTVRAGEFVPLAEETGLVTEIGDWVLSAVCRQARYWQSALPWWQSLPISANLSARHLTQPELAENIARSIAEAGIDPGLLWLEITESAAMDEARGAVRTLDALHRLGVRLVIDDFGTGYSSLLRLRRLPVEVVKIDTSFVAGIDHDPEDIAIVTAVIDLAHALGLVTVAEGVERPEQLEALLALGCDIGQGHLWCEATTVEAVEDWLARGRSLGHAPLAS